MTTPTPNPPRKRGTNATPATADPLSVHQPIATASSGQAPTASGSDPLPVQPVPPQPNPAATRDTNDPGDSTQRNYRYQHAYGVMLLAAARRGERPYVAIWCEHHEDLLGQRVDALYDGFQIKTSRPENGAWRMLDPELVKTIGRFVDLIREFGPKIGDLYFVTNTEFDACSDGHQDEKRRARRPVAFLAHIHSCNSHIEISALYLTTFTEIQSQCGCQAEELFAVLKKMNLIVGPSRDAFLAVLAHEHLGRIPECHSLCAAELDAWRDHLIAIVWAASSLAVTDPIRHLRPLFNATDMDPILEGKRLLVATVMVYQKPLAPQFVFPGAPQLGLGAPPKPHILQAKLEKGGIGDQVDYLRTRERAAEAHLMEDALRAPDKFPMMLRQLEEIVLGECSEAHLRARLAGEPYGEQMLIAVQDRLRELATNEPAKVFDKTYECLMGLVGLLATDTRVWFSSRFPIQEAA